MKTKNHESYTTCKNCGHEYNFWDFGYYCPVCLAHNTATTARRTLLFSIFLFFAVICTAQPITPANCPPVFRGTSEAEGVYLITIKTGKKTEVFKQATTATADSLTLIYTGKTTAQLLANSSFYEHRTRETWFYCEAKTKKSVKSKNQKTKN